MQLLQTRVNIFRVAGSNLCPDGWKWGGGGWGQYRPGQYVSSSFPNAASTNKSGQVVISAPVGWNRVGGQYRTGQFVSSSFPNAASANKNGHDQGVAGSNLCSC